MGDEKMGLNFANAPFPLPKVFPFHSQSQLSGDDFIKILKQNFNNSTNKIYIMYFYGLCEGGFFFGSVE